MSNCVFQFLICFEGAVSLLLLCAFMVWTLLYCHLIVLFAYLPGVTLWDVYCTVEMYCVYTNSVELDWTRWRGRWIYGWVSGWVGRLTDNGLMNELIDLFIYFFIYFIIIGLLNPWKMKALCSFKMLVSSNPVTQPNILKGLNPLVTKGWRTFFTDQWNYLNTIIWLFVM
jgi:hypothetical protein